MKPQALKDPAYHLLFLQAHGYPATTALQLVASHHRLPRNTRLLLARCVKPPEEAAIIRRKLAPPHPPPSCLAIDMYNQLTTIYAALTGHPVYRCTDNLHRDSLLAGPRHVTRHAETLARHAATPLQEAPPPRIILVADSQPSMSRRTAATVAATLHQALATNVETIVTRHADKTLQNLATNCTVATSDTVVAKEARSILDLAGHTIAALALTRAVIDLNKLIREAHREWCQNQTPTPGEAPQTIYHHPQRGVNRYHGGGGPVA